MTTLLETVSLEPFGLYFRRILPRQPLMAQTTQEPEVTNPDGKDPEKMDSEWYPDEDEEDDDDEDDDDDEE
ncbi:MAG: hypothetical protein J2P36_18660 [Ktedonobacteraceae bacterium]|nr:hypothetical protein [Ktedonobacteraceae bacterium]